MDIIEIVPSIIPKKDIPLNISPISITNKANNTNKIIINGIENNIIINFINNVNNLPNILKNTYLFSLAGAFVIIIFSFFGSLLSVFVSIIISFVFS